MNFIERFFRCKKYGDTYFKSSHNLDISTVKIDKKNHQKYIRTRDGRRVWIHNISLTNLFGKIEEEEEFESWNLNGSSHIDATKRPKDLLNLSQNDLRQLEIIELLRDIKMIVSIK